MDFCCWKRSQVQPWPWPVQRASWLLSRFRVRPFEQTDSVPSMAVQRCGRDSGRRSHTRMMVGPGRQRKADPRWASSWDLAERTNEFIVGDKTGTYFARSVRRLPVSEAADRAILRSLGTRWDRRTGSRLGRPKLHDRYQSLFSMLRQVGDRSRARK